MSDNTIPFGAIPISASSGNVANASAVATIAASPERYTYLNAVYFTASGATAGLPVNWTITGLVGGTMTGTFTFPAGVLVGAAPLLLDFNPPLRSSAVNTAIVATLPAGGSGNTNAAAIAHAYYDSK